jgi:homoserine kinase type II
MVAEDDAVRIEELRVRGQKRSIVVTPQGRGARRYEIMPAGAGRDLSQDRARHRPARLVAALVLMAVYTDRPASRRPTLCQPPGLGELTDLQGIRSGIENTNYYATTVRGQWVLTLFERLPARQLPYYLRLMEHLARHGIPVPAPQADAAARSCTSWPASRRRWSPGCPAATGWRPTPTHCAQVGACWPACMWRPGRLRHCSSRTCAACRLVAGRGAEVLPHLQPARPRCCARSLRSSSRAGVVGRRPGAAARAHPRRPVPRQRDVRLDRGRRPPVRLLRLLFRRRRHAAVRPRGLPQRLVQRPRQRPPGRGPRAAFVAAYEQVRPLDSAERRLLPALLRAAALRFWLSRLWDWHLPRDASLLQPKDPAQFERILRERIQPLAPPPGGPATTWP